MRTTTPLLADVCEEENTWAEANFSNFACSTLLMCVSWGEIIYPPSFLSFWKICFLFIGLFRPFVLREIHLSFPITLPLIVFFPFKYAIKALQQKKNDVQKHHKVQIYHPTVNFQLLQPLYGYKIYSTLL